MVERGRWFRKMQVMAVSFYLHTRENKDGTRTIRVSVSARGARVMLSSGLKVLPSDWDAARQRTRRGSPDRGSVNAVLARVEERVAQFENRRRIEGGKVEEAALRRELLAALGREEKADEPQSVTVHDAMLRFAADYGKEEQLSTGSMKLYASTRRMLDMWRPGAVMADLDGEGLSEFFDYLRNVRQVRDSTLHVYHGRVMTFMRWATEKGLNSCRDFEHFATKVRKVRNPVVFLTWEELMRVWSYEIPAEGSVVELTDGITGGRYMKRVNARGMLSRARDFFLFCCFTSLRYSDALRLRRCDIDGRCLHIATQKTSKPLTIELNKYSREVLARYTEADTGEFALPRMAPCDLNACIKDIAELCGINTPVTETCYRGGKREDVTLPKFMRLGSHTGRRTFICNALMKGIVPQVVMKWTGHSDYSSMRPYIDVAETAKAEAMKLFDE